MEFAFDRESSGKCMGGVQHQRCGVSSLAAFRSASDHPAGPLTGSSCRYKTLSRMTQYRIVRNMSCSERGERLTSMHTNPRRILSPKRMGNRHAFII